MFQFTAESDNAVNTTTPGNKRQSKWRGRVIMSSGQVIYETRFVHDSSAEAVFAVENHFASGLRHSMEKWQIETGNVPPPDAAV